MPNDHRHDHREPATEMLTVHSPRADRTQNMAWQLTKNQKVLVVTSPTDSRLVVLACLHYDNILYTPAVCCVK